MPIVQLRRWVTTRPRLSFLLTLLAGVTAFNIWCYNHAWSMTHYSAGGRFTARPELLGTLARFEVLLSGVNVPRPLNDRSPAELDLPFEVLTIPSSEGITLEAWHIPQEDSRAVVLLFHGYATSRSRVLNEAAAFHAMGCETLLVDFRGSGGSTGDVTTIGTYEADDVAAACERARTLAPGKPLFLYGRSMGSVASLRAMARLGVQADGAILECPFDRLLSTIKHRFDAVGLPAFPAAHLMVFWGSVQHSMNGFAHNPVEYAAEIKAPVLLLHGENDPRVLVPEVREIYDALAGEKQFEVFPDTGHEACYRSQPDLWKEHVTAFLDRHAPQ